MRGLMAMDLSARQATLLTELIRDAAQIASAAGIQPIRPEAATRDGMLSPFPAGPVPGIARRDGRRFQDRPAVG